jgi:hypothetical protein
MVFKIRGRMIYLPWSERRAFARLPFLDYESNPEQDLQACPGSFHFQGDDKRFKPHRFTSKFKGKAIAMVERPVFSMHCLLSACCFALETLY